MFYKFVLSILLFHLPEACVKHLVTRV